MAKNIDGDKLIAKLVLSGVIDDAKCGKLKKIIKECTVETRSRMKWTLNREQMPEAGEDVLFCDIDGDIFIGHYSESAKRYIPDFWDEPVKNVRAWMPLPDLPGKEKGGGDD